MQREEPYLPLTLTEPCRDTGVLRPGERESLSLATESPATYHTVGGEGSGIKRTEDRLEGGAIVGSDQEDRRRGRLAAPVFVRLVGMVEGYDYYSTIFDLTVGS